MAKHIQHYAGLSKDTKLITMSIYKGFPSKSYLPMLKMYSPRNLLQSVKTAFGFMAASRLKKKKITAVLPLIQAGTLATSPERAQLKVHHSKLCIC